MMMYKFTSSLLLETVHLIPRYQNQLKSVGKFLTHGDTYLNYALFRCNRKVFEM